MDRFMVAVAKETLAFSAAHFLTLPGHICERLHGHNYRLSARVWGPASPTTGFVVDFAELKGTLRALVERLDHRVLIPARCGDLVLREEGDRLLIDYLRPEWLVVPRSHACLLPVTHTTAERLAEYLAGETWAVLTRGGGSTLEALELDVEESAGQSATFRIAANRTA